MLALLLLRAEQIVKPSEEILTGDGRKLQVVDVVPVEEEDSPF